MVKYGVLVKPPAQGTPGEGNMLIGIALSGDRDVSMVRTTYSLRINC